MSSRIENLLAIWLEKKEDCDWALCSIVEVEGSSYRKPGAMMLVNSLGQQFGLLSGGCLESNLLPFVRQAWHTNKSLLRTFDFSHDDHDWESSLGCGGIIKVLIQPITQANEFLQLEELYSGLKRREDFWYRIDISGNCSNKLISTELVNKDSNPCFLFSPAPLLVICGGGVDAIPLVKMAKLLEWQVLIIDPRSTFAKKSDFVLADGILKQSYATITNELPRQIDAIVCMTHHVGLDAEALVWAKSTEAKYIGLLGPKHRTQRVLDYAHSKHKCDISVLQEFVHNPVGADIGGDTPGSIALSILTEVHAVLEGKKGYLSDAKFMAPEA